jgi:RNA-binding motif X-linked protein 2
MANRIEKLNGAQLTAKDSESWHNDYKDSAYIYIGGLPFTLTEGDIVCIFSQYGEPLDVNLIRDKQTGKSKGFAFLRYADQRSTILAVDNLTGATVLGRALRVDHCSNYKQPKQDGDGQDYEQDPRLALNVAPSTSEQTPVNPVKPDSQFVEGLDPEDPMFAYLVQERKDKAEERAAKRKRHDKDPEKSRRHHRHRHREGSHTRSFES